MKYILIILLISACGCIQTEKTERHAIAVEPAVDYYALGGYTGGGAEDFFVISGTTEEAKGKLYKIVAEGAAAQTEFSTEDELNLVVFRGVFGTGGYGLEIKKVERDNGAFYVFAEYADPGRGMMVTQAFTQPTAIVPIRRLAEGEYSAVFLATQIQKSNEGSQIVYEDKEKKTVKFAVR